MDGLVVLHCANHVLEYHLQIQNFDLCILYHWIRNTLHDLNLVVHRVAEYHATNTMEATAVFYFPPNIGACQIRMPSTDRQTNGMETENLPLCMFMKYCSDLKVPCIPSRKFHNALNWLCTALKESDVDTQTIVMSCLVEQGPKHSRFTYHVIVRLEMLDIITCRYSIVPFGQSVQDFVTTTLELQLPTVQDNMDVVCLLHKDELWTDIHSCVAMRSEEYRGMEALAGARNTKLAYGYVDAYNPQNQSYGTLLAVGHALKTGYVHVNNPVAKQVMADSRWKLWCDLFDPTILYRSLAAFISISKSFDKEFLFDAMGIRIVHSDVYLTFRYGDAVAWGPKARKGLKIVCTKQDVARLKKVHGTIPFQFVMDVNTPQKGMVSVYFYAVRTVYDRFKENLLHSKK